MPKGSSNFARASRAGNLRSPSQRPRGRRAPKGMIDDMLCASRRSRPAESWIIGQPTRRALGRRRRAIRVQTTQSRHTVARVARAMVPRRRARARPAGRRVPRGGGISARCRPGTPGLGARRAAARRANESSTIGEGTVHLAVAPSSRLRPASWSDARRRQFHERLATRGGAGAAPTTARTRAARSSPGEARAAAAGAGQPRHTFAGASGQQTAATLCVPARRAADGVDGRSLHRRAGSNANVDVKVELGFRGWELAGFRSAENTRTWVAGSWRILS